jgi:hypothetical protein
LTSVLLLVAVLLLMVIALVRFSEAVVSGTNASSTWRWGLVYGVSWAAIVRLLWRLVETSEEADAPDLLTLVVAAWGTFHSFWIWLALTLAPAERRSTRQFAGRLGVVGLVVVAVAAVRLANVRARAFSINGVSPLALMIVIALLGVALILAGGIRKARRESRALPRYRADDSGEAEGTEEAFARRNAEAQPALRERDSSVLLMGLGAALMIGGTFGAGIAAGPPPVKLLCGGALLFVAFQVVRYLRR